MDIQNIAEVAVTAVLSIGAVSSFLAKYANPALKYAKLAQDATSTLEDVLEALVDGKLSADEVTKLENDVAHFKADLKS